MIKCQICGKEFSDRGLTYHITHIHKINKKDYYDKYLKKLNEDICNRKGCTNTTKFLGNKYADFEEQKQLLKDLILGKDNYNSNDFNKNNFIDKIPKPIIVYKDKNYTVYGAGKLY